MKNIDINRDIAVGFDRDGNPLNIYGERIPSGKRGERLCMSQALLDSFRRARKLIEPEE